MIAPGTNPGVALDKSAVTRMANTQKQAARQTMPHNAAAQASLKNQYSKQAPSGSQPAGTQPTTQPNLTAPESIAMPSGGPQAPMSMAEGFDPKVFAEHALDTIVGDIRTQQFHESPRVKDAMESIRLKNLMNKGNPKYVPDPRPLIEQVITKIGMDT